MPHTPELRRRKHDVMEKCLHQSTAVSPASKGPTEVSLNKSGQIRYLAKCGLYLPNPLALEDTYERAPQDCRKQLFSFVWTEEVTIIHTAAGGGP